MTVGVEFWVFEGVVEVELFVVLVLETLEVVFDEFDELARLVFVFVLEVLDVVFGTLVVFAVLVED